MICPNCTYWVAPNESQCQQCYQPVFTPKPARKPKPAPKKRNAKEIGRRFTASLTRHGHVFLVIGGLMVISYGVSYYTTLLIRLKINGVHLQHNVSLGEPLQYLVGAHSATKSWAYRDGL